jgi:hypothetical protein
MARRTHYTVVELRGGLTAPRPEIYLRFEHARVAADRIGGAVDEHGFIPIPTEVYRSQRFDVLVRRAQKASV